MRPGGYRRHQEQEAARSKRRLYGTTSGGGGEGGGDGAGNTRSSVSCTRAVRVRVGRMYQGKCTAQEGKLASPFVCAEKGGFQHGSSFQTNTRLDTLEVIWTVCSEGSLYPIIVPFLLPFL